MLEVAYLSTKTKTDAYKNVEKREKREKRALLSVPGWVGLDEVVVAGGGAVVPGGGGAGPALMAVMHDDVDGCARRGGR